MSNLNKRQWLQIILLVVALLFWVLRKANVLYVPGVTGITLGLALGMVGVSFIAQKEKTKKFAGVLVLAFGLLNILVAFFEIAGMV